MRQKKIKSFYLISLLVLLSACGQSAKEDIETKNLTGNKLETRTKIWDLMKIPEKGRQNPNFEYKKAEVHNKYTEYRLSYHSNGEQVPGHLLIPNNVPAPYPVMICLQGHAPGMFISLGEYHNEYEKRLVGGGRDLAIQAIEHGWAALVIEQKGFGERQKDSLSCNHQSLQELLEGRTMLGQRVYDISRAIDMICLLDSLDKDKIGIIGNSSGGTTAYYAAAMDERIDLTVVSCSFCTFESSWLKYPHCACGYLPGLLEIADMPDLARLIAPRNLIIVAGEEDYLADIEGVIKGFAIAREWYKGQDICNQLRLIIGEGGHQFYPGRTWPVIQEMRSNLIP